MEQKHSPLKFMIVSASIAFAIATIIVIATGWGLLDAILLVIAAILGGALIGAAVYLEHYYGKNSVYAHEMHEAVRKKMQLVKDAICESSYLKNHPRYEGENSITVTLYDGTTHYRAFSARVTPSSVTFSTVMLDRSNGRKATRELTITNADDEDIQHTALRHLSDSNFIDTLTPLTREVRA